LIEVSKKDALQITTYLRCVANAPWSARGFSEMRTQSDNPALP